MSQHLGWLAFWAVNALLATGAMTSLFFLLILNFCKFRGPVISWFHNESLVTWDLSTLGMGVDGPGLPIHLTQLLRLRSNVEEV